MTQQQGKQLSSVGGLRRGLDAPDLLREIAWLRPDEHFRVSLTYRISELVLCTGQAGRGVVRYH